MKLADLLIQIYADGADLPTMLALNDNPLIKGLTTNPSLMRKAGVVDYERFCREVLSHVTEKPISFEVFADDFEEMERQALRIASWGQNVYVKIPVINSRGESSRSLIRHLSGMGVKLNITAIFTHQQLDAISAALSPETPAILSAFNGRRMDCMLQPLSVGVLPKNQKSLWASVREPWNIWQAAAYRYDIITVPADILKKAVAMEDEDADSLCLATVQQFLRDGEGYSLAK